MNHSRISRLIALCAALAGVALAQAPPELPVRWRPIGGRGFDLGLAAPAGGAVSRVVFLPDGPVLLVRTASGRLWQSADLGDSWLPADALAAELAAVPETAPAPEGTPAPRGDLRARLVRHPFDSHFLFALGKDLYRSPDGGRTWINLTDDGLGPIIGPWQASIAFSPADPDVIVVGNSAGLWKSVDGGLTWSGLNSRLPNFAGTRILAPRPGEALLVEAKGFDSAGWIPGAGEIWRPAAAFLSSGREGFIETLPLEDQLRLAPATLNLPDGMAASFRLWHNGVAVSADLTACAAADCEDSPRHFISAFAAAGSGETMHYVGTSDGRIWVAGSNFENWRESLEGLPLERSAVVAIHGHPANPGSAVAVFAGAAGGRVFRTTNGGVFWDDLTANLPLGEVAALAVSPQTGSLYVGGELGVFYTQADLLAPSEPLAWRSASGNLPQAAVRDLELDTVSGRLYALAEGYGVYHVRAPEVLEALRVLNAADLSTRPAAPGGLLTVVGGSLRGATVGGNTAPILSAGSHEAQLQVPFESSGDRLEVGVVTGSGRSVFGYPLAPVSPAIFADPGGPLVLDAGTGRLLGANLPARAASQILILATGLGRVRPNWPTGVPAPLNDPPETVEPVKAYLNGAPLRVVSSTLAGGYIGTYIVQVELPAVLNSGSAELAIEAGNRLSNAVRIFTEP